jgi:hypothetical protein
MIGRIGRVEVRVYRERDRSRWERCGDHAAKKLAQGEIFSCMKGKQAYIPPDPARKKAGKAAQGDPLRRFLL